MALMYYLVPGVCGIDVFITLCQVCEALMYYLVPGVCSIDILSCARCVWH